MLQNTKFLKDFECYFLDKSDSNYKKSNISEEKLQEFKHMQILKTYIDKYLQNKYNIDKQFLVSMSDIEYLNYFKGFLVDIVNPAEAMFMLPDGSLKKVKLDLSDFKLNEIFTSLYGITKENLYNRLNLDHQQIRYLGLDIYRLFKLGCIRISCNDIFKEFALEMDLQYFKPSKECIKILEELALNYTKISIDFTKNEHKIYTLNEFNLKKDIDFIYNSLHVI